MLTEELGRLERDQLARIAEIWNATKIPQEKKSIIALLSKMAIDEYFLKGVLEKLTPVQVKIYSIIITNKNTMTLGEISRRVKLLPINVEKELAVLKHLMLVYQRKNRERITSNLDKYYPFDEIREIVSVDTNKNGEKFQISIKKEVEKNGIKNLDNKYLGMLGKGLKKSEIALISIKAETFKVLLKSLSNGEITLIDEVFTNGGLIEINAARVLLDEHKLHVEKTIRKLNSLYLLRDEYFVDERFVRVLVLPIELFSFLKENPLFPKTSGIKELQQKKICNQLDFVLNIKKLMLFISNKGLTLSQSRKIKQADMKRSEISLQEMDFNLFTEKSQVHQIEILLPFLKILDLVELRGENVILKQNYEEFLKVEPLPLIKDLVEKTAAAAERRIIGDEVFIPIELPFYRRNDLERCVQIIAEFGGLYTKVLVAELIREWVVLSPGFRVRNFKNLYIENRSAIVSALLYMHSFGLLEVEYPKRFIRLSEMGRHYFFNEPIKEENETGAVIINPDASLIALEDKLSVFGLHMLKSFTELKDFDTVYNFQITKESLQEGVLLGNSVDHFVSFLESISKNKIPQNLKFLIKEWSDDLPIVSIDENVTLLETSDEKLTELLLGQIKGKKIIKKELSPTAMIIFESKINEVMEAAEKLEMIVKLTR